MKRRQRKTGRSPILDGLERRVLLTHSIATGVTPGGPPEVRLFHPSGVERVSSDLHRLTVNVGRAFRTFPYVRAANFPTVAVPPISRCARTWRGQSRGVELNDDVNLPKEYPVIDRLGEFVSEPGSPDGGYFLPVQPGSVGANNTQAFDDNVYVIAHGWMPGYDSWVSKALSGGKLPLSWQTWLGGAGVGKAYHPSTPWLYKGSSGDGIQVNDTGLAEEILKVDPNATVLAYSWIDESTTPTFGDIPKAGYQSEGYTTMAGMQMAEGIMDALAPNYYEGLGKVHLIGHSHGARVATVAALALQRAALNNPQDPQYNVVRQLTLFDSPEDNGDHGSLLNPVNNDSANFDWFYLAQLNMPGRYALTGTVTNGQNTVTAPTIAGLSPGMGVTGAGVPAGTTIDTIVPSQKQVILSAPVNVSSSPTGASLTLNLGFWNWSNDAIFVDSYSSYFGTDFGNFVVNDPDQGISTGGNPLYNVVDAELDPVKLYGDHFSTASDNHQYSANWYAGSASTKNTPNQDGLFWSPLISGSTLPAARSREAAAGIKCQTVRPDAAGARETPDARVHSRSTPPGQYQRRRDFDNVSGRSDSAEARRRQRDEDGGIRRSAPREPLRRGVFVHVRLHRGLYRWVAAPDPGQRGSLLRHDRQRR